MARKGTELRTDFTGDDTRFNKVIERQKRQAREFGDAWGKAGRRADGAMAGFSRRLDNIKAGASRAAAAVTAAAAVMAKVGFGKRQTAAEEASTLIKQSRAVGADFELFQRQQQAAEKADITAQNYFNTLNRLTRKVQEGVNGSSTVTDALAGLGISDVDAFAEIGPTSKILALAEAYKNAPDQDAAFADLAKLMERDAMKFRDFFAGGAERIAQQQAGAVGLISVEAANKAEKLLDDQLEGAKMARAQRVNDLGFNIAIDEIGRKIIAGGGVGVQINKLENDPAKQAKRQKMLEDAIKLVGAPNRQNRSGDGDGEDVEGAYSDPASGAAQVINKLSRPGTGTPTLMNMRSSGASGGKGTFSALEDLRKLQNKSWKVETEMLDELKLLNSEL